MGERRIVVLPDIQAPSEDRKAVANVARFVHEWEPDALFCVGDEADSPEPSRWSRGSAEEYAGTLQAGFDRVREVMGTFRVALGWDRPFIVMRSNHSDRLRTYVKRYSPALSSLRDLRIERQLGYDELDIEYKHHMWEFHPGWVLAHGDEGSLIQTAGGTALNLAKRLRRSVIAGHTHRLGMQHDIAGFNGKTTSAVYGYEVGHLMDVRRAGYLKTGSANWQQGFLLLHIKDRSVYPTLVPIVNRSFVVEGKTYAW